MKKALIALLLMLFISPHLSANEDITSTIEWLSVFSEYGNGDAAFLTKDKGTICYGYWLSGDDPGFDKVYATLLSAFHSNSLVQLNVGPGESAKWPASSNHYCKVVRVALTKG